MILACAGYDDSKRQEEPPDSRADEDDVSDDVADRIGEFPIFDLPRGSTPGSAAEDVAEILDLIGPGLPAARPAWRMRVSPSLSFFRTD